MEIPERGEANREAAAGARPNRGKIIQLVDNPKGQKNVVHVACVDPLQLSSLPVGQITALQYTH